MRPLPVLMYHHVNPHKGDIVTVTPDTFRGQMEYLSKEGYQTLKIDGLMSYINGELVLDRRAVVVTFDDGWLDNYLYAFPLLEKYRINATVFVITDRADRASAMTGVLPSSVPSHEEAKLYIGKGEDYRVALSWEHIQEMSSGGLVEFCSHTKSHRKCDELGAGEIASELLGSKERIEEKLKITCHSLCWPYGRYNGAALDIAKKTGYKAAFTINHGVVKPGTDPYGIKRIVVKDNVEWFKKRMAIYTGVLTADAYLLWKKIFGGKF